MTDARFRSVLKSQYHAALAMLREAVERCPENEWSNTDHKNAFWQVAYHTLFFTHLYLQRDEAAFQRWAQHRGHDDGVDGDPYTQAQVLAYWSFCDRIVIRSEEHTSELQSLRHLVCRLLLEKKKKKKTNHYYTNEKSTMNSDYSSKTKN